MPQSPSMSQLLTQRTNVPLKICAVPQRGKPLRWKHSIKSANVKLLLPNVKLPLIG